MLGTVLAIIVGILLVIIIVLNIRLDMVANKRKNEFLSKCDDEQRKLIADYRKSVNVSFKDLFKKSK